MIDTSLAQVFFSFGRDQFDNYPLANSCWWHEWGAWLNANRSPQKGVGYITTDFKGDGRRCNDNAYPRNWLAMDLDDRKEPKRDLPVVINTDAELLELVRFFNRWPNYSYETFSSAPGARRARWLILLSRKVDAYTAAHIGRTLIRISPHPKKCWDHSVWQASQPVYVCPDHLEVYGNNIHGVPLDVDNLLKNFPIPPKPVFTPRPVPADTPDAASFFKHTGRVLGKEKSYGFDVVCPWLDQHTKGDKTGSAYFYPSNANGNFGGFKCQHTSCAGRSIRDIFELITGRS